MTLRIATFLLLCTASLSADPRTWTDAKGRTIQADIVSKTDSSVTLQLADGSNPTVPLSTLSAADQKFVSTWFPLLKAASISFNVQAEVKGAPALTDDSILTTQTAKRQRFLDVKLRAGGIGTPTPVKLVFFFIGHNSDSGGDVVYSLGWINSEVSSTWNEEHVRSDAITETKTQWDDGTGAQTTGIQPDGWVMYLVQNGTVVASTASTPDKQQWLEQQWDYKPLKIASSAKRKIED